MATRMKVSPGQMDFFALAANGFGATDSAPLAVTASAATNATPDAIPTLMRPARKPRATKATTTKAPRSSLVIPARPALDPDKITQAQVGNAWYPVIAKHAYGNAIYLEVDLTDKWCRLPGCKMKEAHHHTIAHDSQTTVFR